jgi:hypothetical protein
MSSTSRAWPTKSTLNALAGPVAAWLSIDRLRISIGFADVAWSSTV